MTYADFEAALIAAGQEHLVNKMEEYAHEEAQTLIRGGLERSTAVTVADSNLAGHIEGWLTGNYGKTLTPDAVFSHRAALVHGWALAEAIRALNVVGVPSRKS